MHDMGVSIRTINYESIVMLACFRNEYIINLSVFRQNLVCKIKYCADDVVLNYNEFITTDRSKAYK